MDAPRFFMGVDFHCVPEIDIALEQAAEDKFDFICVPLAHPRLRHDRAGVSDRRSDQWTRSDVLLPSTRWTSCVVGKTSPWLRLDSDDTKLRRTSEVAFKREAAWASHLGVPALLVSAPPAVWQHSNLARCVNQLLSAANFADVWLEVPITRRRPIFDAVALPSQTAAFEEEEDDADGASGPAGAAEAGTGSDGDDEGEADDGGAWQWWSSARCLCDHQPRLGVALVLTVDLPSEKQLDLWLGEPLRAVILPTSLFLTNRKGFPVLPKPHQRFVQRLFPLNVQFTLRGNPLHKGERRHYLQYLAYLATQLPPKSEQDAFEGPYYDRLQVPLQPLADNLESQVYETFEKDPIKYSRYEEAIFRALRDRCDRGATVMVVGAGRGPLVSASLRAADRAACAVRLFAVEKNPNAIVTLRGRVKAEWGDRVTVVAGDMREWATDERADIMVSELLGSFSDNELSPECLDGAMEYLRAGGVCIPRAYTSFAAPVMSSKLWNSAKAFGTKQHLETPYVVRMFNAARLASPLPCFSFEHPSGSKSPDNARFATLRFPMRKSALVHGFGGYFECDLFDGVGISINPPTASEGMFSWFPCYFPLQTPMQVQEGDIFELQVWRVVGPRDVWYEWAVTSPRCTPIHNANGHAFKMGL